ncbi:hypothetical protein BGZ63DRAFT_513384 [Mariannaea sp. PMI_226]|nr:hypothetical protein BGZ63DRAFT_513384 [Mariannaea sp. PMI_226]
MRPLNISLCAAALASSASAFNICAALGCIPPSDSPAVSFPLEIKTKGGEIYHPILRIDLEESNLVCDPSGVRVVGQPLPIDDKGRGMGHLRLIDNYWVNAKWEFSCASPKDSSTEHKLVLVFNSIGKEGFSEETIPEARIETRFRQTEPVVFTSAKSNALAYGPNYSHGTLHYALGNELSMTDSHHDL